MLMPRKKSFHIHTCIDEILKPQQLAGEQDRELLYFYHLT